MKRKRLVIISISFLAAVILAALLWPREREPEYEGIPLSGWLEAQERERAAFHSIPQKSSPNVQYPSALGFKSDSAIRHIGTNALPFLVRRIQYKPPFWRRCLFASMRYWPKRLVESRWTGRLYEKDAKAQEDAESAMFAFALLGSTAKPALPELRRLAKSNDPDTSRRALTCIDVITNPIVFDGPR